MRQPHAFVPLVVVGLLAAGAAEAKRNVPQIALTYRPTEAVGAPRVTLTPEMLQQPVVLRVEDARAASSPSWIGTRTDDDDVTTELHATNDVTAWAQGGVAQTLGRLGIHLEEDADLTFEAALVELRISETNQAVGATYNARAGIRARLIDGGRVLWEGTASGDATRYGKKFSADNTNEVLSDALAETVAAVLDAHKLQRAWSGQAPEADRPTDALEAASAITPNALFDELRKLVNDGVPIETMLDWLRGRTLTAALSADEVLSWRAAGVPEPVLREALRLPVR